ncbi:MAG: hypothetical protein WD471_01625 [Candidatus Paceibacterota bacterium]
MIKNKIKQTLILSIVLLGLLMGATTVQAQTSSEVIITWQANNFYPSDYPNKAGVTRNTPVFVGLNLLENGSFANMSGNLVTWYLDGHVLKRGPGIDEVVFTASKSRGGEHKLRVIIETPSGNKDRTITIPIVDYDVVLNHSEPELNISPSTSLKIKAIPYFFNITSLNDLIFSWNVNNETRQTDNLNEITLNIGGDERLLGTSISVNSIVANRNNSLESARTTKTFIIR